MTTSSMNLGITGEVSAERAEKRRYQIVTQEKAGGATYTPKGLADFVAREILSVADPSNKTAPIRVLDPAIGDGELLLSLLQQMDKRTLAHAEIFGFETDDRALRAATKRLRGHFPKISFHLQQANFLQYVLERTAMAGELFGSPHDERYDLIIANPPYVRTQIMGARQAQLLAKQFGLAGRVDLYHAFLLGMAEVLNPSGTAGVIVSNRFMTTKSGASVRRVLRNAFKIPHVWDFGDTKIFDAAVLPAVLLLQRKKGIQENSAQFTSIYETTLPASAQAPDAVTAVMHKGIVEVKDGRRFEVRHGELDSRGAIDGIWRIATEASDDWLTTVERNTWRTFRSIGKIRVGVKTCADSVFIRDDWHELPTDMQPELLRPLITHHIGRRFRATIAKKPRRILYPHQMLNGTRIAADLGTNPRARAYLESHRNALESRRYVVEGGRKWYEIWVPQDPSAWCAPKLVFRDICESPMFWIDLEGSVVNGDCYWLAAKKKEDDRLLWLAAAVGNSTFIEAFYDHRFHNKLYSGRRRFMTQYVEQFPLPNPDLQDGQAIISTARSLYETIDKPAATQIAVELNRLVWKSFDLDVEEVGR